MTPEKEAIDLLNKYSKELRIHTWNAKDAAIICVDKIISVLEEANAAVGSLQLKINYYKEVKKEIEKL